MGDHRPDDSTGVDEVTTPSVIDECLRAWGPDLFAYLLGAGAETPLAAWRLDRALADRTTRARLGAAHAVYQSFDNPQAARAWVRRRNPELGNRPPAELIRAGTADDLLQVRDAVERQTQQD